MKTQQPVKKVVNDAYATMKNPNAKAADCGSLTIHEGALATIVKRATAAVPGVARFSGSSFIDNIAEIVRSRKIQDRSISLTFREDRISVDVSINVVFGVRLPEVAAAVQAAVSDAIRTMTGLKVEAVNVNIRDMEEPAAPESAEEQQQ